MKERTQSIIYLLEILTKYSDEDHILNAREIQDHLLNEYGVTVDRRTLYEHIKRLKDTGYEISSFEDNGKGCYLVERQFEKGEVLLLCNAIHASHFISSKQSNDLIKKLLKTQSKYQQAEYHDRVYMSNPLKANNKQLLYNIEIVSEAIKKNRQLSFTYLRYDMKKQLVPRRKDPYIVEPRYIVYQDSRAYVVVTSENHPDDFIHYRIDRMKDPKIIDKLSSELPKTTDPYEYAKNKLFMYTGITETVTFRCKDSIIDQMIDIFGPEVGIITKNDGFFLMNIRTSKTGAMILAQQFMDSISIVQPEEYRKEFVSNLKSCLKSYQAEQ